MQGTLERLAGVSAILGGLARIGAGLLPADGSPMIEALYDLTDVLMLLGLIGWYARYAGALGWLGVAGFAAAVAAFSFIGGPDADPFPFSTYQVGAAVLAIAMTVLSAAALLRRAGPPWAPIAWIAALALGIAAGAAPQIALLFVGAGLCFGLGFVLAGLSLLRAR